MPIRDSYHRSVFLNCPFDPAYRPLLFATIFAVHYCGFLARAALEISDSSQTRLTSLFDLIAQCRYGIHDLSRTSLDPPNGLPRFNMPFELGIFLGCKRFGPARHRLKSSIVLDSEPYRYQQFLSDIAGQDILSHHNDPRVAITHIRNWLRTTSKRTAIAGGNAVWEQFVQFQDDLPHIATELRLHPEELTFVDYRHIISLWQERTDPSRTPARL